MLLPLWNVGGGVKHRDKLIPYFRDNKVFYDTSHKLFNYVYDSIFGLKWNGGRVCLPSDFMAIPNLIALLALSPVVIKLAKEYGAEHFTEKKKA